MQNGAEFPDRGGIYDPHENDQPTLLRLFTCGIPAWICRHLDAHNIAARELKPACKAAGLPPIGWHTLRHTAVTLLQQAGATGAEAKAFAGHGSVGMTERYTHAEVERMRGSVEALKFGETKTTRRVM